MLVSAQFDFSGAYARLTGLLGSVTRISQRCCCLVWWRWAGLLSAILVNDIVAFALTPLALPDY